MGDPEDPPTWIPLTPLSKSGCSQPPPILSAAMKDQLLTPCSRQAWNPTVRPPKHSQQQPGQELGGRWQKPLFCYFFRDFLCPMSPQCPLLQGPPAAGPRALPDQWGTADITSLTFLDEEALVRQPQGVLIHLDLDGCLLVLVGLEKPEGLIHEQVLQAVMSEAWGSGQLWSPADSGCVERGPHGPVPAEPCTDQGLGASPLCPWGFMVLSTTRAGPWG